MAYADDVVLVAKNRGAITNMLGTLKRFLRDRSLRLNTDKTKIMVFNREKKEKRERWTWEGRELEEVQAYKYLGFVFNRNGSYAEQIKELKRKGRLVANMVWSLGERVCKYDYRRRWILFNYLVKSVMEQGVEIWGWEERKELEKVKMDISGGY